MLSQSRVSDFFSSDYWAARSRFLAQAERVSAQFLCYPIYQSNGEAVFIDVAIVGEEGAPSLVVSSGVHGVEGFLGSAVQLALLNRIENEGVPNGLRYVFIHAVNPFGFSRLRRTNEDNIDINRNFLLDKNAFQGAPEMYGQLGDFLNPKSPPSMFEPFRLKALYQIWRYGYLSIKQAIAGGQYEFSRGLFFGGSAPSQSYRVVETHCSEWIGKSMMCVHLDLHTGLGAFSDYRLLMSHSPGNSGFEWFVKYFDEEKVEPLTEKASTAYKISGMFGDWMQARFKDRCYRFVGAEFGTYDSVKVLRVLRAENRAHFYAEPKDRCYQRAKDDLLECFAPKDLSWRETTVEQSLKLIDQAEVALSSRS